MRYCFDIHFNFFQQQDLFEPISFLKFPFNGMHQDNISVPPNGEKGKHNRHWHRHSVLINIKGVFFQYLYEQFRNNQFSKFPTG